MRAEIAARYPNVCGETPSYDAAGDRLLWVDALWRAVREATPGPESTWELGRTWTVSKPPGIVVPWRRGGFVATQGPDVVGITDDGDETVLATFESDRDDIFLHDAKCDAAGRLLTGWRVSNFNTGGLLRVDPDGSVEVLLDDVRGANGLDWSPDGETLYYIDTFTKTVEAFDYDAGPGRIANRRTLVTAAPGEGLLDGMCTDHEGCLWVTHTYAGELRRYSPRGELVETVETPTPILTSCAFGGPEGRELFVTAHFWVGRANHPSDSVLTELGITEEQLDAAADDVTGGAVYVCHPDVTGPPATPFAR